MVNVEELKKQSPSARLASLAAFVVPKRDVVTNDIFNGNVDHSATAESLVIDTYNSIKHTNDSNFSNIPSDIKLGSAIPSNCSLVPNYSSLSSNSLNNTPLSDITSENGISSNVSTTKKKFKFSPANVLSTTTPTNNHTGTESDKMLVHHLVEKGVLYNPNASLNKSANIMNQNKFLKQNCNDRSNAKQSISSSNPIKIDSKKLESNRYIPGQHSFHYGTDSDDDFQ